MLVRVWGWLRFDRNYSILVDLIVSGLYGY